MKTGIRILMAAGILQGAVAAQAAPSNGLAERVNAQIRALGSNAPAASPVAWYAVPAISSAKRLPDAFPEDGKLGGPLQIVAARNEFEPASFVVFAFQDFEKAELKASELKGAAGVIPASSVDLKIVKVWYQGGTAWYSYFADTTGHQLVPELLLNDENLVRVDASTRDNYLRVDAPGGSTSVWISHPVSVNVPFNSETEPVSDAASIQPFRLEANAFKQLWVTVRPPAASAPGLYTGALTLSGVGGKSVSIPLSVRVLPFELPAPATYYDPGREFYTMLYNDPDHADILKSNGGDTEQADRKMRAIYANMRDHNIRHPRFPDYNEKNRDSFIRQLELLKEAGLATDPLFGGIPGIPPYDYLTSTSAVPYYDRPLPSQLVDRVEASFEIITRMFGHSNVYCFGWDEPSRRIVVAERKPWKYIHDKGLKIYSTGTDSQLKYSGYNEDFVNCPGAVTRERAAAWHAMKQRITNYASPHTGPENPDYMRRVHGLTLYKANYDGVGNYILNCKGWNDFLGEEYNFRGFNMTYPTRDGVIDTLAWEGTREAVDDVRYATVLKTMAEKAITTGKTEAGYAGRQALQWLELTDEKKADLNTVRLEMVDRILALRAYAEFPQPEKKATGSLIIPKTAAGFAPRLAAPTPEELVSTNRLIMKRPKVPARIYTKAVFTVIDQLAVQKKLDEVRTEAEAAGASTNLAVSDRYYMKLIAAALGGAVQPAELKATADKAAEELGDSALTVEARVNAIYAAGKFFMTLRQYPVVRAFMAVANGYKIQAPKKSYACSYLDKAPVSVEAWQSSALRQDPKNRESRFEPYNRKAAELLINDVNVERSVAATNAAAGPETAFYMACDADGWRIYVECADPEVEKVAAGLLGSGSLELFFATGYGTRYYQGFLGFPSAPLRSVDWDSPHAHFRPLLEYARADSAAIEGGFGAALTIPWELVYDRLPANGDLWPFNIVRWSRSSSMTWGGKVHNISAFGTVRWEGLTSDRLLGIKRKLVMKGFGNYQKTKVDLIAFWKDDVLGDPAFYAQSLLPVVEKLDALGAKVGGSMTAGDVESLFVDAVPDWMEFNYRVAALRRDYLAAKLAGTGPLP